MKKIIPCEECLKLAMCKYKTYNCLVRECDEIQAMLYEEGHILDRSRRVSRFKLRIKEIEKLMNPHEWKIHGPIIGEIWIRDK